LTRGNDLKLNYPGHESQISFVHSQSGLRLLRRYVFKKKKKKNQDESLPLARTQNLADVPPRSPLSIPTPVTLPVQ